MNKCLLALFLLFGLWPEFIPAVQEKTPPGSPYVERNHKEFKFYPGGRVEIYAGVPGSVEIQGWERATVEVESEVVVYYLTAEQARGLIANYPLRVRYGQTTATITTSGPPKSAVAQETNLKLRVPMQRTDIKTNILQGDLKISRINGWIEADLEQGDVEISRLQGYLSVTTKAGDLRLQLEGKRWLGQGLTAATQRGSVSLRLPLGFSAALQLDTKNGNLTIDYPEQEVEGEKVPLLAVAKGNGRSLTATVGDGGAPVRIQTSAGDIDLAPIR
jgi:DUF4097 and DUF4098 domain-containing protein YvlB